MLVEAKEVKRLGRSTRELRNEEYAVRVVSGVTYGGMLTNLIGTGSSGTSVVYWGLALQLV